MFGKVTKVKVTRPQYRKEGGSWVEVGQDEYELTAFGEIGTSLMMEAPGVVIDVEGKIRQREVAGRNGNTWRANNFIIDKYTHNDD
jgi:hypothetical protein